MAVWYIDRKIMREEPFTASFAALNPIKIKGIVEFTGVPMDA